MSDLPLSRRSLISGNWKMNFDHHEALHAARDLGLRLQPADVSKLDVSVHPPFTDLRTVQSVLEPEGIPVTLGAQNCAVEDSGAFTGEVSPLMLAKLHVDYVIVGHSERRRLFGETDDVVRAKVRAVMRNGMTPICCVGETIDERDAGLTEERLAAQVEAAFGGMAAEALAGVVIAYEPLWAIGSGTPATPEDAQEACRWIREVVERCADTLGLVVRPDPVRGVGHRGDRRGHLEGPGHRRCPGRRGQSRCGRLRRHHPGRRTLPAVSLVASASVMKQRRKIEC